MNCGAKPHHAETRKHGRPAEAEPDSTIFKQGVKMGRHRSRTQTLFKSSLNLSNLHLYQ